MFVSFLPFIGVIFAVVQIHIFRSLPKGIRNLLAYVPILGIIMNFAFSSVILVFTGTAAFVGMANIFSSVIFAFYIIGYASYRKLNLKIIKKGLLKYPVIEEFNTRRHWLF